MYAALHCRTCAYSRLFLSALFFVYLVINAIYKPSVSLVFPVMKRTGRAGVRLTETARLGA